MSTMTSRRETIVVCPVVCPAVIRVSVLHLDGMQQRAWVVSIMVLFKKLLRHLVQVYALTMLPAVHLIDVCATPVMPAMDYNALPPEPQFLTQRTRPHLTTGLTIHFLVVSALFLALGPMVRRLLDPLVDKCLVSAPVCLTAFRSGGLSSLAQAFVYVAAVWVLVSACIVAARVGKEARQLLHLHTNQLQAFLQYLPQPMRDWKAD